MACKNCNGGNRGGMVPIDVGQQGFQQAQLYGNQYGPGTQSTSYERGPKPSWLKGSPGYISQSPTQTQQQLSLSGGLINQIGPLLQQLQSGEGRYAGFDAIENANQNRWNNYVLPSIAQRFNNMTGESKFGGGGYAQELGKAYGQSASEIGALKAQYGLQNQSQLQNLLSQYLSAAYQPQFQTNYISPTEGLLHNSGPLIGGAIGAVGGGIVGGPAGALTGASLGATLGGGGNRRR